MAEDGRGSAGRFNERRIRVIVHGWITTTEVYDRKGYSRPTVLNLSPHLSVYLACLAVGLLDSGNVIEVLTNKYRFLFSDKCLIFFVFQNSP